MFILFGIRWGWSKQFVVGAVLQVVKWGVYRRGSGEIIYFGGCSEMVWLTGVGGLVRMFAGAVSW